MIYKKDGETLDHIADNRLLSANSVPYTKDTIPALVSGKRDNLLAVKDYSDYEVKHMTKGAISCYNDDTLVYSFMFDMAESNYKAYGSTNSGKAIFMINPRALVIPPEALNVTITNMGQTSFTTDSGIRTSVVKFNGLRWRTVVGAPVRNQEYGYTYGKAFFMNGGLTAIVSNDDVFEQHGPGSWSQITTNFELPGTSVYNGRITKFVTKKIEYDILTNEENS